MGEGNHQCSLPTPGKMEATDTSQGPRAGLRQARQWATASKKRVVQSVLPQVGVKRPEGATCGGGGQEGKTSL